MTTSPYLPRRYRVRRRQRELADTWTLELEPVDHAGVAPFSPGQFAMLYAFGVGEIPISTSGAAPRMETEGTLVHTVRAVGAVSKALCSARRGTMLGVRGPYGRGWPLDVARGADLLIVAGGLGLAPLRPAIHAALAERDQFGDIVVLYGTRSPADLLFEPELRRWRSRFDIQLDVTVDHATSGWQGRVGVVTSLLRHARFDPDETVALVCGPEVMMRSTARSLLERGVAAEAVYLSLERNMKCALGHCGHCQLGRVFVCRDGPVFAYSEVERMLEVAGL